MKVIVFGSTGGTGRAVMASLLATGHEVTAFARNVSALADNRAVRTVRGDAMRAADVGAAIPGYDAVDVSLGNSQNPFAMMFGARRTTAPLEAMLADAEDRIAVNRRAGELTVSFGGDTNQAGQFSRSMPDFVLKGRFSDVVRLDLHALEQKMGFAVGRRSV